MNVVLVVDDEPQLVRALRITLTARGYDVRTATPAGARSPRRRAGRRTRRARPGLPTSTAPR